MTRIRIELGSQSTPMSECEKLYTSRIFIFLQLSTMYLSREKVLLGEKRYYLVLLFSFEGFMGLWYALCLLSSSSMPLSFESFIRQSWSWRCFYVNKASMFQSIFLTNSLKITITNLFRYILEAIQFFYMLLWNLNYPGQRIFDIYN